jgi:hypothetical protein
MQHLGASVGQGVRREIDRRRLGYARLSELRVNLRRGGSPSGRSFCPSAAVTLATHGFVLAVTIDLGSGLWPSLVLAVAIVADSIVASRVTEVEFKLRQLDQLAKLLAAQTATGVMPKQQSADRSDACPRRL